MKIKSDHRRNKTQTKPRTTLPPSPLPLMIHHRRAIIWHDRLGAHAQQQTKVQTSPRHPSRWSISAVHPTSCCEAGTDGFVFLENLFTRLVQSQKKALAVTLSSFLSRVGFLLVRAVAGDVTLLVALVASAGRCRSRVRALAAHVAFFAALEAAAAAAGAATRPPTTSTAAGATVRALAAHVALLTAVEASAATAAASTAAGAGIGALAAHVALLAAVEAATAAAGAAARPTATTARAATATAALRAVAAHVALVAAVVARTTATAAAALLVGALAREVALLAALEARIARRIGTVTLVDRLVHVECVREDLP